MRAKVETERKPVDAKLFWIGRSQAVRLPKEFRFEGRPGARIAYGRWSLD